MIDENAPFATFMGFERKKDEKGRLLLLMPWDESKAGRPGFIHGGALAGFLESVAFQTLSEALGPEDRPQIKPINVTVNFMRGARQTTTFARATITRLGKRIANVEAIAWQEDEAKPVAMAQLNVLISRG